MSNSEREPIDYTDYPVYRQCSEDTKETIDNFMKGKSPDGSLITSTFSLKVQYETVHKRILKDTTWIGEAYEYSRKVIEPKFWQMYTQLINPVET